MTTTTTTDLGRDRGGDLGGDKLPRDTPTRDKLDPTEQATRSIAEAFAADWITVRQAAAILGTNRNTAAVLARTGKLEALKVGMQTMVSRASVERMCARRAAVRALQSGELEPGDLGLVPTQHGPWSGQAPRGG